MDTGVFSEQFTGILYGLGVADFAIPIGFLLWSLIFLISLDGIELTDIFSRFLYMGFCMASGVTLCLAIPAAHISFDELQYYLIFIVLFGAISSIVWGQRKKRHSEFKNELLQEKIRKLNEDAEIGGLKK
ncbi:MAG: hypothetical protein HRU09_09685 [Oligoflexales bacterium]|nr:hypothetical protein [Oligoflexales bacterium]